MRGTLNDPGFPAAAKQFGLINYWKMSHTKPDVCREGTTAALLPDDLKCRQRPSFRNLKTNVTSVAGRGQADTFANGSLGRKLHERMVS